MGTGATEGAEVGQRHGETRRVGASPPPPPPPQPEGRITVLIVLIRPAVYANLSAASNIEHNGGSSSCIIIFVYTRALGRHVGEVLLSYDLTLPPTPYETII